MQMHFSNPDDPTPTHQEFNYMSTFKWFGFVPGVIIIFVGISLLSPPDDSTDGQRVGSLSKEGLNVNVQSSNW